MDYGLILWFVMAIVAIASISIVAMMIVGFLESIFSGGMSSVDWQNLDYDDED